MWASRSVLCRALKTRPVITISHICKICMVKGVRFPFRLKVQSMYVYILILHYSVVIWARNFNTLFLYWFQHLQILYMFSLLFRYRFCICFEIRFQAMKWRSVWDCPRKCVVRCVVYDCFMKLYMYMYSMSFQVQKYKSWEKFVLCHLIFSQEDVFC